MDQPDPAMSDFPERVRKARVQEGEIALWYTGGAGYAAHAAGATLLIDPFLGPSNPPDWLRAIPPAFAPERIGELGPLEAVLITHEHSDHADPVALAAVATGTDAVVYGPASAIAVAEAAGVPAPRCQVVSPDEAFAVGDLRITPVAIVDPLAEGCAGYVLDTGSVTLLHCGDSLYFDGFVEYGKRWTLDALCVSVGNNPPGATLYMDEADAARAARDCRTRMLIPQHYDLWQGITLDPRRVREVAGWYTPETKVAPARLGRRRTVRRGDG